MRAIKVYEHGGIDQLVEEEASTPEPTTGEVLVEVKAVGVNHLDVWVRRGVPGHKFPLPLILGSDACGIVRKIGVDVNNAAVGDEVIVAPGLGCGTCEACLGGKDHRCRQYQILGETRDGAYATALVVPERSLIPKPPALSFEQGAAIGIPFLTAWHMLVDRAEVRPGDFVLVQAGGSGVGSAAIQIAVLWGARVMCTVGSEEKVEAARSLGAEEVVVRTKESFVNRAKAWTDKRGVDVIIDHVGADIWEDNLRALAWHGRLVTCGATSGGSAQLNLRALFFKAWSLLGSTMGSRAELGQVVSHVASGKLRPILSDVLPLSQAGRAHQALEERNVFGKIVLTP